MTFFAFSDADKLELGWYSVGVCKDMQAMRTGRCTLRLRAQKVGSAVLGQFTAVALSHAPLPRAWRCWSD